MISDFVKGRARFGFPPGIQKGIMLHRQIDAFTDEHPVTRQAKKIFQPDYRLYSGAFMDVVYDHFLARDPAVFTRASLLQFSADVYAVLEQYQPWLPARFAAMLPYMKEQNWLYNYHTVEGIRKSFGGLVRRAVYLTDSQAAGMLLNTHYQLLQDYYRQFWSDLLPFARSAYETLTSEG